MTYEIKMMNGDIYEVTEEEANGLMGANGLVFIKRLNLRLNFSSLVSISQKGLAKNEKQLQKIECHDGSIAILKNGVWIDEYSNAVMDIEHYPELLSNDKKLICN